MSIIEPEQGRTIGPEPAGPAIVPEVTEPVVEAPEVAVEAVVEEPDTFDREYVEKLRRENAKWRTTAKEYEETFGDLDDEDKSAWLQIIQLANSGDPEAIQYLGQALGFVNEEPPVEPAEQPQYLTPEQAREIARQEAQDFYAEQEEARSRVQQIETIQARAKNEFGVEPGSDEYVVLLHRANQLNQAEVEGGDLLAAAHAQLQAEKQAQWDAFVASKEAEAQNSPQTMTGTGVAPSTARVPETWAEARNALHERLSNLP